MKLWPAILLLSSAGMAQPTEHVTVTGSKDPPRLAAEHFVQRFTVASAITGKMARWDEGVCPITVGLGKKYAVYITSNLRRVAREAGAPVNGDTNCKPNIEIVFTTTPQKLADGIRRQHPFYLGHASSDAQRDELARVRHPVQAWYTTAMRDLRGNLLWDSPRIAGSGEEIRIPCIECVGGYMNLSSAIGATAVTGGRLGDGMRSIFYHVIIVAEPAKLGEYEVGTLADYIALLALSRVGSLDACQPLSSIVNLLAKNCANAPAALTAADMGYLKGLYSMSADGNLRLQQDGIAQVMLKEEK